jgi:hypothetical protein
MRKRTCHCPSAFLPYAGPSLFLKTLDPRHHNRGLLFLKLDLSPEMMEVQLNEASWKLVC